MTRSILTLMIALAASGGAFAADDNTCSGDGKCCHHSAGPAPGATLAPSQDIADSDATAAAQASEALRASQDAKPNGTLTPAMKAQLAKGQADIARSVSDIESGKSCCDGASRDLSSANAFDGATTSMQGKCPGEKH